MDNNDFNIKNHDIFKANFKGVEDLRKIIPEQKWVINTGLNETMRNFEDSRKNMLKAAEEARRKKEQYDQDVLNTLKQIEGNTANLTAIINLIQKGNKNQEEIYNIIAGLLALAKEKDKEVVESKYRKIMNKITSFTDDVEAITTLTNFGIMIFNILKAGA